MSTQLNPPSNTTTLRLAQITALFLSATLSGVSLSISTLVVPRLLESPVPLMLRQWHATYTQGKSRLVPWTLAAGSAYFYLASRVGLLSTSTGRSYLVAGALSVGIVPYTLLVMMPTNRRIEARAEAVKDANVATVTEEEAEAEEKGAWVQGEGSKYLVDRWATLNLGRAVMVMASTLVGLSTALP